MTSRRGLSLIELVAAMGVAAMLVGLGVTLIHSLLRVERLERASLAAQNSLSRLSTEFRRDVHASLEVTPDGDDGESSANILLESPARGTIKYSVQHEAIVRTWNRGDGSERKERFALPRQGAGRLKISRNAHHAIVSLSINCKVGKRDEGKSREFRVDACLGRDHRFVAGE